MAMKVCPNKTGKCVSISLVSFVSFLPEKKWGYGGNAPIKALINVNSHYFIKAQMSLLNASGSSTERPSISSAWL